MSEYTSVKDSGKRENFSTGAVRDTAAGKGRYDLLPTYAIERLARHFENGAVKYGDENWRKGIPLRRFLDSALRHTFKYLEGYRDEDHASAAVWNLMALIETEEQIKRGRLPVSLNNLPNWLEAPIEPTPIMDEVVDALPASPASPTFADYEGTYQHWQGHGWITEGMKAVKVRPSGVYRVFDDRCELFDTITPEDVKLFIDNGWWVPQVELPLYTHPSFPKVIYRINGDVLEVKANWTGPDGEWGTSLFFTVKQFQEAIDTGVAQPIDLDACGTTDGITPLPGKSLAGRVVDAVKRGGKWIVEN